MHRDPPGADLRQTLCRRGDVANLRNVLSHKCGRRISPPSRPEPPACFRIYASICSVSLYWVGGGHLPSRNEYGHGGVSACWIGDVAAAVAGFWWIRSTRVDHP